MAKVFRKDEEDIRLDFKINWNLYLEGDNIIASVWDVPAGITSAYETFDAKSTTILLTGGTNGEVYDLKNTVTLDIVATTKRARTITIKMEDV